MKLELRSMKKLQFLEKTKEESIDFIIKYLLGNIVPFLFLLFSLIFFIQQGLLGIIPDRIQPVKHLLSLLLQFFRLLQTQFH